MNYCDECAVSGCVCIVFLQGDTCKFFYAIDHRYIFAFTVYINFYTTELFYVCTIYGMFIYTSCEVMHVLCMHVIECRKYS